MKIHKNGVGLPIVADITMLALSVVSGIINFHYVLKIDLFK